MQYDGLHRRIVKAVRNSVDLDCTYHYYYDDQWRIIEERNGSDQVIRQNVWGQMYIDELVQTGLNHDPMDTTEQLVERFFYAMHDANFNALGIASSAGRLIERYEYTPYGERTVYSHGWIHSDIDGDGIVSNSDNGHVLGVYGQSGTHGARLGDLDGNGEVDGGDIQIIFGTFSQSLPTNDPAVSYPIIVSHRPEIAGGVAPWGLNPFGHQGLMHDEEVALIQNRHRMLHPRAGRFMQRDPLGYVDGMSLYLLAHANSISWLDPSGLVGKRREVELGEGFVGHIDLMNRPNGTLGGHIHIIDKNGREVAKVSDTGAYAKTHKGRRLLKPSQLPRSVRNRAGRLAKRLPYIGTAAIVLVLADDVNAHGVGGAAARATPVLGDFIEVKSELEGALAEGYGLAGDLLNYDIYYGNAKAEDMLYQWLEYELQSRPCPCPGIDAITKCVEKFGKELSKAYRSEVRVETRSALWGHRTDLVIKRVGDADITAHGISFQECLMKACLRGDRRR